MTKVGVHVICRHPTALGVGLAGIAPIEAATAAEAATALTTLAQHAPGRGGVVLVEQQLHDQLPPGLLRQIRKDGAPIVVAFPGPSVIAGGEAADQELLEVVRRAVGYRMRLR